MRRKMKGGGSLIPERGSEAHDWSSAAHSPAPRHWPREAREPEAALAAQARCPRESTHDESTCTPHLAWDGWDACPDIRRPPALRACSRSVDSHIGGEPGPCSCRVLREAQAHFWARLGRHCRSQTRRSCWGGGTPRMESQPSRTSGTISLGGFGVAVVASEVVVRD